MRRRFFNISGETFDYSNYMTIEALDEKVYVSMPRFVEYGIDGRGWYPLTSNESRTIKKGQLVSFKGSMDTPETYGGIKVVGKFNLKGNCLSLVFGDEAHNITSIELYPYLFEGLFLNNKGLIEVEKTFLPATTIADSCYSYTFAGCTSLVNAPELPATILAGSCYEGMFAGCTSLTTAPELPATILAGSCYYSMFNGCTSLTTAPELPATELEKMCYYTMFYGCTSLVTATELPATTLKGSCYYSMFNGCNKLNYIKMLATYISASECLRYWVKGVASSGTFVKNPEATWDVVGDSGVPEGWTVKFDGEEEGKFINLQTQIINGYGEYSQEQANELFLYLKETYGDNGYSGEINDFKYTFNDFHITYFIFRHTPDSQIVFMGQIGDKGEVHFDGYNNYIMLY